MKKIILILLTVVLLAGCDPLESNDDPVPEEPVMVVYNDSRLEIRIAYLSTDDADDIVEVIIPPDSELVLESGVTDITILGGSF